MAFESGSNPSIRSGPIADGDYLRIWIIGVTAPVAVDSFPQQVTQRSISLPMVGAIPVSGLSEIEAESAIAQVFQDKNIIQRAVVWVLRISPNEAKQNGNR